MVHLKHRSASGDLSRMWEYDPIRRVVMIVVDGRGADIPVCCEAMPRQGAYSIRRLDSDGTCWEIAPSMFDRGRGKQWARHIAPYPCNALPPMSVQITHAPPNVTAEMDRLFYEECPEPEFVEPK